MTVPPTLLYAGPTDPENGLRFIAFQSAPNFLVGCFVDSLGAFRYACVTVRRSDVSPSGGSRLSTRSISEGYFATGECLITPSGFAHVCVRDAKLSPPHEGIALVENHFSFGYMRVADKEVLVKPQFKHAYDFSNGRALVMAFDKWGYVGSDGQFALAPTLNNAPTSFHGGGAWLRGCEYLVGLKGVVVAHLEGNNCGDREAEFSEGLWYIAQPLSYAFVDTLGHTVHQGRGDAKPFKSGLSAFRGSAILGGPPGDPMGRWGYKDRNGKIVIAQRFTDAESFSAGFARVVEDGRWGWINRQGRYVWRQPLIR